jgi:hypothetical protein
MKIFVAFGYNERDKWIPEMVFPLIEAFGDEVVTGEELLGDGSITEAVRRKIRTSEALIGFATRRDKLDEEEKWGTHRWVTDEIALGIQSETAKSRVVEVREQGVVDQGGVAGDRQRIEFDETARDKCLLELVKTIGRWHREQGKLLKLQLLPADFVEKILPVLSNSNLRCTYSLIVDDELDSEPEPIETKIRPIDQGLYIRTRGIPHEALIQVRVEFRGETWISNFVSTDSLSINLRPG